MCHAGTSPKQCLDNQMKTISPLQQIHRHCLAKGVRSCVQASWEQTLVKTAWWIRGLHVRKLAAHNALTGPQLRHPHLHWVEAGGCQALHLRDPAVTGSYSPVGTGGPQQIDNLRANGLQAPLQAYFRAVLVCRFCECWELL